GELVVVIARDDTIERERGALPVFPQEQRRRLVEALGIVDKAILGYDSENHSDIVVDLKPDYIALGYDQYTNIEALEESFRKKNMSTEIIRLKEITADGLSSSTLIRERILKHYMENGRPKN
ncbi:MAG: hypothetical protein ACTSQZ_08565, partial [Candidatus Thorarchaeota archaeon]